MEEGQGRGLIICTYDSTVSFLNLLWFFIVIHFAIGRFRELEVDRIRGNRDRGKNKGRGAKGAKLLISPFFATAITAEGGDGGVVILFED
ncbi:hypothetical protein AGMMS50284_0940 [Clostridia bacterium]|nr:hypothetical protein AGMMS50284_0940 [Clostridia bacterium]